MADFKNLIVWQKARLLVKLTYRSTRGFPPHEMFGLAGQMQRAAISILSNIAEGYGRGTDTDFSRFLKIARGSLFELESQYYAAFDLGYLEEHQLQHAIASCGEVGRLLTGMLKKLHQDTIGSR